MVRRRQFLIATGSTIGSAIVLPRAAWSAWRTTAVPAAWPPAATTLPVGNMPELAQNKGNAVSPEDPGTGDCSSGPGPRTLLIYDPAFALACRVATHARRNGGFALALENDAGALWYRSILPFLEQDAHAPPRDRAAFAQRPGGVQGHGNTDTLEQPIAITGLTPHAAFFVLSTLATTAGMRISNSRSTGDRHLVAWQLEFPADSPTRPPENPRMNSPMRA
jgi:hypothetical protein